MATTDAKSGFRLPWSAERGESDGPAGASADDPSTGDPAGPDQENETPAMIDAAPPTSDQSAATDDQATSVSTPDPVISPARPAATSGRKPNKFMADLTRAMQAAAETARAETLARFGTDAKTHIETIHASTATEATELRKKADDDVAAIREWSKTEIARIREETDERINHRKTVLEREIEAHAAEIEGRIELVQKRVNAFEAEMARFFERLLAEDDPTRFASMAESLPEPPPFDPAEAWEPATLIGDTDEPVAEASTDAGPTADAVIDAGATTETLDGTDTTEATVDATADAPPSEAPGDETGDLFSIGSTDATEDSEVDPRLAALGASPDFAAAEAEAATFDAEGATGEDEIAVIGDDALAARLAGLVPDGESASTDAVSTRVVVTGLVSVASIAGFKRNLSRVAGVQSVGVSSGPDGEFVFAIGHDAGLALDDAITTLPGFAARVTDTRDGELTVAARDPEAES
ncbi:MAG: hypothetical protein ACRDIL_04080 [Candidatus Limnocylindrales bacterium]